MNKYLKMLFLYIHEIKTSVLKDLHWKVVLLLKFDRNALCIPVYIDDKIGLYYMYYFMFSAWTGQLGRTEGSAWRLAALWRSIITKFRWGNIIIIIIIIIVIIIVGCLPGRGHLRIHSQEHIWPPLPHNQDHVDTRQQGHLPR